MQEKIVFQTTDRSFDVELTNRAELYFQSRKIKKTGNLSLYVKAAVLLSSFVLLYCVLVFSSLSPWTGVGLCLMFGGIIASIGFNIMHDGAHGSFSSKRWVNETMGHSLNLLGGNVYLWKYKHNTLHHTYTNIEGVDEDIDIRPVMRTNEAQKKYWFHRYQHFYCWMLYPWIYIIWVYKNDFVKYFSGKIEGSRFPRMNFAKHVTFWVSKVVHVMLFIVVPLQYHPFSEWFRGFLIVMLTAGMIISIVFQLAHVVAKVDFPVPTENKIKNSWFLHQLATTANFSPKSKFISWWVGGLNYQIEHHLFKKISHVHYPALRKIVKQFCTERGVFYFEFKSFFQALAAHFSYLKYRGAH